SGVGSVRAGQIGDLHRHVPHVRAGGNDAHLHGGAERKPGPTSIRAAADVIGLRGDGLRRSEWRHERASEDKSGESFCHDAQAKAVQSNLNAARIYMYHSALAKMKELAPNVWSTTVARAQQCSCHTFTWPPADRAARRTERGRRMRPGT